MTESLKLTSKGIDQGKPILSDTARYKLKQFFAKMTEGSYLLTLTKDKTYKKSRYKYLFGCVYLAAVTQFNQRSMFQIEIEETGEQLPLTVEDLHEMMKSYFNQVVVRYKGFRIIKGGSTKKLTDTAFLNEFLEKVFVFLSEHSVIVPTYGEWRQRMEAGETCEEIIETSEQFKDHS